MAISKDVNYDLRQYALWVEACVNEHGGSGALASWEQIEKVVNAHDALVSALEAMREEFRGADLPYGSSAYLQSGAALALARGGK